MPARAFAASSGRVYRVDAVVIRRISIGETDRVVTLFSREKGKFNAVAKGARGPRSRLAGATEPFTHVRGLLAQGQSLDVLTQAEVREAFAGIRKNLARVGYASYYIEVVDAGVEERQPSALLWDLLVQSLRALETAPLPDLLTRGFELQAMEHLGYEPQLDRCVLGGESVDTREAAFHPTRGGLLCALCKRSAPGAIPLSEGGVSAMRALRVASPAEIAGSGCGVDVRSELAKCMVPYVRHHLEAPLRSLQFLDDVAG